MTSEKAIKVLNEIIDEGWLISYMEKCVAIDACEMAIKALEQEPILDKIRAEIIQLIQNGVLKIESGNEALFNIIDKYNVESEVEVNAYDVKNLFDNLDEARIYAGAEFERLCNNNQHIDACVFQSIRDSIAQNIQLLQSYIVAKHESEVEK